MMEKQIIIRVFGKTAWTWERNLVLLQAGWSAAGSLMVTHHQLLGFAGNKLVEGEGLSLCALWLSLSPKYKAEISMTSEKGNSSDVVWRTLGWALGMLGFQCWETDEKGVPHACRKISCICITCSERRDIQKDGKFKSSMGSSSSCSLQLDC